MSGPDSDVNDLYERLGEAAPAPPLSPLRVPQAARSERSAPLGPLVTGGRRLILRILSPSLVELVGQLERERHQQRLRIAELEARVAQLEGAPSADR